jgi:hypothetical protein
MRRHPAFQDLSRDHFVALNRSLQVLRAVEGHPSAQPYEQAVYNFSALWTHDGLRQHFGEEEADLVPVLQARSAPALAQRMLDEHARLRAGFHAVGQQAATRAEAADTARALMAHARWEEDVVFEWLQDNLADDELAELGRRSRDYRQANGLPVGPPRPS